MPDIIQKCLNISTKHIPPGADFKNTRSFQHGFGYVVFVMHHEVCNHMAEWIHPIMMLARDNDCFLIHFDDESPVLKDVLTVYE